MKSLKNKLSTAKEGGGRFHRNGWQIWSEYALQKKMKEDFAINFWEEFKEQIINDRNPKILAWISDDYIETIFDLYFIKEALKSNSHLTVKLISRKGRWGNDANHDDIVEFLEEPELKELETFIENGRFVVLEEAIMGEGLNGKNISVETIRVLNEADFIFCKGLEGMERLNGMKKIVYFGTVVSGPFSESTIGLSKNNYPLVLIRENSGEKIFKNFETRAWRKLKAPNNGDIIWAAGQTAWEYAEKEKRASSLPIKDEKLQEQIRQIVNKFAIYLGSVSTLISNILKVSNKKTVSLDQTLLDAPTKPKEDILKTVFTAL